MWANISFKIDLTVTQQVDICIYEIERKLGAILNFELQFASYRSYVLPASALRSFLRKEYFYSTHFPAVFYCDVNYFYVKVF